MDETRVKERHGLEDYLFWTMTLAVPTVTGLLAIFKHSVWWFVGYIVILIAMVAVLMRFFCTHCPHYSRDEKTLKCMLFWGVPKYFDSRPGPYNFWEKSATYTACLVIVGFPVYWLLFEPGLLIIYVLSYLVFGLSMKRHECWRCAHEHCPMNAAEKTP